MTDDGVPEPRFEGDVLAALAHPTRRHVVAYLQGRDGEEVALSTLARAVRDRDRPVDDGSPGDTETALHHRHLPVLAEAGVVEYDPDAGTVRYAGHAGAESLLAE